MTNPKFAFAGRGQGAPRRLEVFDAADADKFDTADHGGFSIFDAGASQTVHLPKIP